MFFYSLPIQALTRVNERDSLAVYQQWHIPFSRDDITLQMGLDSITAIQIEREDIPLMMQLAQTPKLQEPGSALFFPGMDMQRHDCIHLLLGRGLLIMDEAFSIGFTMGTSKKMTNTEHSLYAYLARYIYPDAYKFTQHELAVLKDGIKLSFISNCMPLDQFNFQEWLDEPLGKIREVVGLEPEFIEAYYAVEKRHYPHSVASQRLLPEEQKLMAF